MENDFDAYLMNEMISSDVTNAAAESTKRKQEFEAAIKGNEEKLSMSSLNENPARTVAETTAKKTVAKNTNLNEDLSNQKPNELKNSDGGDGSFAINISKNEAHKSKFRYIPIADGTKVLNVDLSSFIKKVNFN